MSNKEKFIRFCVVWLTFLITAFLLLKFVLVQKFGDFPVIISVSISLFLWVIFFLEWGPIRGNWKQIS